MRKWAVSKLEIKDNRKGKTTKIKMFNVKAVLFCASEYVDSYKIKGTTL